MSRAVVVSLFAALLLSGCAPAQAPYAVRELSASDGVMRAAVLKEAATLGVVDGFFFGEVARNFKSGYASTSLKTKTDFAIDYENMLKKHGENMLKEWGSYVPYSIRAQFARQWWANRSSEFNKETEKMKIVWMHEALLDGGELWFRALERLSDGAMDSPTVLTHDEEQRLVYKYAENEHSEGSLSTQLH